MWANVSGRSMQGFKKVEFDTWKVGMPRGMKEVIFRTLWTSFNYVSGHEIDAKSDEICVGGVVDCKMYTYPIFQTRNQLKW